MLVCDLSFTLLEICPWWTKIVHVIHLTESCLFITVVSGHFDCSTTVHCHNVSVPPISCHQHSHDCFIRMLSINMACWLIIVICHQQSHNYFIKMPSMPSMCFDCSRPITVYCHNTYVCQSINSDCFWKPIKLLRTHPVDAEISDGSYRHLANYR